jgi:hypothetical protein
LTGRPAAFDAAEIFIELTLDLLVTGEIKLIINEFQGCHF